MDKSKLFFYSLLAFLGGIFADSFFRVSGAFVLVGMLGFGLVLAVLFGSGRRFVRVPWISFLGIIFLLGMARHAGTDGARGLLPKAAGSEAVIYGYVGQEPSVKEGKQQFVFYVKKIEVSGRTAVIDERVLVTARRYPEYGYGQELRVRGQLKLPQNPDGFDYKNYLAKDDIFTVVYYPDITDSRLSFTAGERLKIFCFNAIFRAKNAFVASMGRSIHEPDASYLSGVLLGVRSQIPADILDAFRRTGTSHILAVSGFNITIIASVLSAFFLLFFKRSTAFWFSAGGIIVFTILTGAQASVVRAAVMGLLVLLASREGRLSQPRNALALAAAVMVYFSPRILRYDIGFQLSFGATLGLLYVSPVLEKYFAKWPGIFGLRESLAMTLSAQVSVLPLLIYYFKNISLVSLPANIIVLPTVPLAMLLGFLTGLAGILFPIAGRIFGYFAWLVSEFELNVIKILAKPGWSTVTVSFQWYWLLVSYILIIAGVIWFNRKNNVQKF